jgi:electron transfer flavoprotein beta subunit
MRIAVCLKEVLDPDAVTSLALAGRLEIAADGRTLASSAIPRLLNGYDEHALEAALRLRDAGTACTIAAVSAGAAPDAVLRHAFALGTDSTAAIALDPDTVDHHAVAALLAAWLRATGGADLVFCGRQASDDDQAVVPALLAERLGLPLVSVVRHAELAGDARLRAVRVTPDGDETVEVELPAVVTVTSVLGTPRYPTAARKLAARRHQPERVDPAALLPADELRPRVTLVRRFVLEVHGRCEMVAGDSAAEAARALAERLRAQGVWPGAPGSAA